MAHTYAPLFSHAASGTLGRRLTYRTAKAATAAYLLQSKRKTLPPYHMPNVVLLGRLSETWTDLTDDQKDLWLAISDSPRQQFIGQNLSNARAGLPISHSPAYTDTLPPPPPVAPDDGEPLAWLPPHLKYSDATGDGINQADSGPPDEWDEYVINYEWDDGTKHFGVLKWAWDEEFTQTAEDNYVLLWTIDRPNLAGQRTLGPYATGGFTSNLFYPDLPAPTALAQWHAITLSWQTLEPETRVESAADWLTLIYASQSEEPPEPDLIHLAAVVPTAAARVPQSHTLTHLTPGVPYTLTMVNAAPNGGTSYPVHVGPITPT